MTTTTDAAPRLTLRRRIVGSIAILSALGLLTAGLCALIVERARIHDRVSTSLAQELAEFRQLATSGIDPDTGQPFVTADRLITVAMQRNIPAPNETQVGFVPNATIVAADSDEGLHREAAFRDETTRHLVTAYGRYTSAAHPDVLYAVLPVDQDGQLSHYVIAHDMGSEYRGLGETIRVYGIASALAWVGLVLAAWMLARRILAPIDELSITASLINDTDLNRRLTITGGDEVSAMGITFNRMLDRLQDALAAQRRMLDDAGHELRTPITVIRGHLELMDCNDPDDVESTRDLAIDELDRMNLMVQDLLLLAKSQRPDFLTRERVDLQPLLVETLDKASAFGPRAWCLEASESLVVQADRRRLTQALLQLASNAYTVTDIGDVIAFGCGRSADRVQIWVRDTGPGVPPQDRERIWERFQSGTGGRSGGGTGLGLAIVHAIAVAHGGIAYVADEGVSGARFVVEIPLDDAHVVDSRDDAGTVSRTVPLAIAQASHTSRSNP